MRVLVSVMGKEFRHILRDPWALVIVTVGAVLLILLLAYTFSADVEHVPIVVLDSDRSPQSRAYLKCFANDKFFNLKYWTQSHEEAREWVESGQAQAAIIVPSGFSEATLRGERIPVQIIVDGIDPYTAQQILGNAEALSASFSVELLEQWLDRAGLASGHESLPFELRVRTLYNPNLKWIHSILPGLMAIILALPALSSALSLAREKELGSLEGLMATPIRPYQLLIGKVVPYLLVGLLDVLLLTVVGMVIYGLPFRGSVADLFFSSCLFMLTNLGIGLLVSSLVRTQMAALIISGVIFTLPPINEAGIFYPLYAMSPEARMQSLIWPATHYVPIVRGIFLKGVGFQTFLSDVLFLLIFGLLLNSLAVWRLKKKLA